MITNNFRKLLIAYLLNSTVTGGTSPKASAVDAVNVNGTTTQIFGNDTSAFNIAINAMNNIATAQTSNSLYIKVGTGNSPATPNDYELANINSNITVATASAGVTESISKVYTVTLNNPTNNDITISEIGLYAEIPTTTLYTYGDLMLDRTILATPITIPAGESKAITYEISL